MKKLRKLVSRLNALFHRDRLEQDLDDELAFHQDMQVREKTAAGVDVEQARLEARREFGRPLAVKEACRDLRLIAWIESVIQDIRFGLRSLTKTKGLAVVAVVTLAVGIGANTTMFSAFNALSLQPLPFRDSSSLVLISEWNPRKGVYRRSPKFATVTTILEETDLFENIGLVGGADVRTVSGTGEADRVVSQTIDVNTLRVLGAEAAVGRIFQPGDAIAGKGSL